jgi:AcrR family transcriptional regulator
MSIPFQLSEDGVELTFATNHLGHFALTGLLLDRLLATAGSRIVTVSSNAHRRGEPRFDDPRSAETHDPGAAYDASKLANLLFTYELQRRLAFTGGATIAVAAHPGNARTDLWRTSSRLERALIGSRLRLLSWLVQGAEQGSWPTLRAAADAAVSGGDYYGPRRPVRLHGRPRARPGKPARTQPCGPTMPVGALGTAHRRRVPARDTSGRRMSATKRDRYHHGDLRAALLATAIELVAERGVRDFSLAEASRRLGVAVSAPYAHFADRDALLAAVAVHALELFRSELEPELARAPNAHEQLATVARAYVRFASAHEPLFRAVFAMCLDKSRHPDLASAERPIEQAVVASVRGVARGRDDEALAAAVEAIAHGYAMLLLDGRFGRGRRAMTRAADSAARSTLALVDGWHSAPTAEARGEQRPPHASRNHSGRQTTTDRP